MNNNLKQDNIASRISQLKNNKKSANNSTMKSFDKHSNGFPNALPQTNSFNENMQDSDLTDEGIESNQPNQTSSFKNFASSLVSKKINNSQKVAAVSDFATKLAKAKKTIAIISAVTPYVLPVIAVLIVAVVVMGQIMTVRDNISELANKFTTGIEKFINFAQGDGWMTQEEAFFDHIDKQYELFSSNAGGDELDIPLIAATVHYSTTVDLEQYEKNDGDIDDKYIQNNDFEQLGSILNENQTLSFYTVARDKLGSVNTVIPGQKRLLGHLASSKIVIVFVNGNVADEYWKKFSDYFIVSAGDQLEDIYWNTPLSLTDPISLVTTYNEMVSYYKQNRDAFAGMKYDYANKFYEVEEFMHYLKLAIKSFFPGNEQALENNDSINESSLAANPNVVDDMSNTEKYIPEEEWGSIPVPFVVLESNYGYDEYHDLREIILEMKQVLKENNIEYTSAEDVLSKAENSSISKLNDLYQRYEEINDDYKYSYTHYLENLYIPFTYFYKQDYTSTQIDTIIEEIYNQRDFYDYLINEEKNEESSTNDCSGGCTYNINGKEVSNLKVRLMQCKDGTWGKAIPGEQLVDFEKYILGVVYAEIGPNAMPEVAKAQAIAARNFALTRPKSMGNAAGLSLKKENDNWILSIRNCTEDQVYCDPDKGCSNTTDPSVSGNSTTLYSGVDTKEYTYKGPLAIDAPIRSAVNEVAGKLLFDEDGNIVKTNYTNVNQENWKDWANQGMDYTEILLAEYSDGRTISTPSCTNVCNQATGDFTQWKQCGAPWSNNVIGNGKTICSIGCLATSVSIQIARSGVPLQKISGEFNPGTFVEAIKPNGFVTSSGNPGGTLFVWDSAKIVAPSFRYNTSISLTGLTQSTKAQQVQNLISQGCYVVMEVKGNGGGEHYVAVDYVSNGKVYMMDPASTEVDTWKQYPHHWTTTAYCYKVTN